MAPDTAAGQFQRDHERDMADPEYAEAFREATDEVTTTAAETMPSVKTIDDAEFWIAVMHRRTCRDADHYVELLDRLGSADAAILQLRRIVAFLLLATALLIGYLVLA